MKRISLLILMAICFMSSTFAQPAKQMPKLIIDAPAGAAPWSSLDFNNNPYNFQFAIVSDRTGGHRPGVFLKGIQKLNLLQPEFVMSVGDLIEGYTEDLEELNRQWNEFNGFIDSLSVPFFYLPGNHDITNQVMEDLWIEKFGETYYSFVYGDVLFLCLNSEDQKRGAGRGTISDEQFEWAKKVLAENESVRWTLIFMHQPLWHQEDTKRWNELEGFLAERPHTVFTGHEHRYVQENRNNGNYFVLATTGGGSSLRGPALGEFDHVVWITMTEQGPMMANLQLEGIIEEDIVTAEAKENIRSVLSKTAIQIEPLYIKNKSGKFKDGNVTIKITNDENVPMMVKFQEGFSWDLSGNLNKSKLEVAPNSVETITLALQNRRNLSAYDLKPFKLKSKVSYDFEDAPIIEFPFTYFIKPEPKYALDKSKAKLIDGDLSDWKELTHRMGNENGTDFSAKFDLAYDDDFLYVAVKVQDDEVKVIAESSPWTQDYVGIVVNNNTTKKSALDVGSGWFRESLYRLISPQVGTIASNNHGSAGTPEDMTIISEASEEGYVMEAKIPMSFIQAVQGENWESLRFNLLIGDSDSNEEQQLHWFEPNWRGSDNRVGSGMFFRK